MVANDVFWDKAADKYAASPIKNMEAYEQTMERTRAYLGADQDVLEVGCGTGSTALLLADTVKSITATDISGRMVEIGREKAEKQGASNIHFRQLSLPDETLQAAAFDTVLCFNTLHLVTDAAATLRSFQHVLKPGGYFISKTVCLAEQTRLWGIPIFLLRLIGKAPYVSLFKFNDLERLIQDAGFEIVETGIYPAPFSRFIVARKI